ncbi:hypothetical protein CRG98_021038 [Punica granatum]|uniref:Uncharacterized protein n=1 Tax=Punica granatum TaxID=22663 RepID=A0A2I0JQL0_PUNGR|nr:hypothetical protein CRG98_021038 [Punica granatum]
MYMVCADPNFILTERACVRADRTACECPPSKGMQENELPLPVYDPEDEGRLHSSHQFDIVNSKKAIDSGLELEREADPRVTGSSAVLASQLTRP